MAGSVDEASGAVFASFGGLANNPRAGASASLDTVVAEFESLFINEWLKAARGAEDVLFEGNPMRSQQVSLQRDWHDAQMARQLAQRGGLGLSDVLRRQLDPEVAAATRTTSRSIDDYRRAAVSMPPAGNPGDSTETRGRDVKALQSSRGVLFGSPGEFVAGVVEFARDAAARLSAPVGGVLAQAALETGWGGQVPRRDDGSSSFNLFGIKAGSDWTGPTARVSSREFVDGRWIDRVAEFRAYEDLAAGFEDYVKLLATNPRYASVLETGDDTAAFAAALQRAGYATDPRYADKIVEIAAGAGGLGAAEVGP